MTEFEKAKEAGADCWLCTHHNDLSEKRADGLSYVVGHECKSKFESMKNGEKGCGNYERDWNIEVKGDGRVVVVGEIADEKTARELVIATIRETKDGRKFFRTAMIEKEKIAKCNVK